MSAILLKEYTQRADGDRGKSDVAPLKRSTGKETKFSRDIISTADLPWPR